MKSKDNVDCSYFSFHSLSSFNHFILSLSIISLSLWIITSPSFFLSPFSSFILSLSLSFSLSFYLSLSFSLRFSLLIHSSFSFPHSLSLSFSQLPSAYSSYLWYLVLITFEWTNAWRIFFLLICNRRTLPSTEPKQRWDKLFLSFFFVEKVTNSTINGRCQKY